MNNATTFRVGPSLAAVRWLTTLALVAVLAWLAGPAGAATVPPAVGAAGDDADPPGRVGRIADLQGQVWAYSPESGEWIGAERNRVVTNGDRISTDGPARAELRVGSTTFRLDGDTEIEMARLDDERIDVRVHSGSVALRIRNRDKLDEIAVLTGEGRFVFHRIGRYRIDRADEASHLTVYEGQGLYEGPRSALTVYSGQRAEFWIDRAGVAQYTLTDPRHDAFSAWSAERDRAEDRSASSRYVSPEMTGVEDLDRHGNWQHSDIYGPLWVPYAVAPGWAPYSAGHWAWVRPWGWTWVDDAPWGFAPFHYGRWVWFGGRWSWAPGQRVLRPVFAPALVAWVGGSNFSFSISVGGGPAVGWFPLAPREVYVPSYHASPTYVRNVNITHVTNVTVINNAIVRPPSSRDLRNRKFPHAVTVVPADVVSARQPVAPVASRLRDNPVVRQVVQSTIGAAAPANAFAPPVAAPSQPIRPRAVTPPGPPPRAQAPGRPPLRDDRGDARGTREDRRDARDAREDRGDGPADRRDIREDRRLQADDRRNLRDDRRDVRGARDDGSARAPAVRPVPQPSSEPRRPPRRADRTGEDRPALPARPQAPAVRAPATRPASPDVRPERGRPPSRPAAPAVRQRSTEPQGPASARPVAPAPPPVAQRGDAPRRQAGKPVDREGREEREPRNTPRRDRGREEAR